MTLSMPRCCLMFVTLSLVISLPEGQTDATSDQEDEGEQLALSKTNDYWERVWHKNTKEGTNSAFDAGVSSELRRLLVEGFFQQLLAKRPHARAVDLGCGAGDDSIFLAKEAGFQSVLGVDISENAIHSAKKKWMAQHSGNKERIHFLASDAFKLPEKDFDLVWDHGLLHNFVTDPRTRRRTPARARRYVSELVQLTRPGAHILILSGNREKYCPLIGFPALYTNDLQQACQAEADRGSLRVVMLRDARFDIFIHPRLREEMGDRAAQIDREGGCPGLLLHLMREELETASGIVSEEREEQDAQQDPRTPDGHERCSITRRQHLTASTFQKQFWLQKPVIMTNFTPFRAELHSWEPHALKKTFGKAKVVVGTAKDLLDSTGERGQHLKLRQYVEEHLYREKKQGSELPTAQDPLYLLDREFLQREARDHLERLAFPRFMDHDQPRMGVLERKKYYMAMGGVGAGVFLHAQADAVFAALFGRIRFFLFSPQAAKAHAAKIRLGGAKRNKTTDVWLETVRSVLDGDEQPLVCVLDAGDLLYIPEGWSHASQNLEVSVGMYMQMHRFHTDYQRMENEYQFAMRKEDENHALDVLEESLHLYPGWASRWAYTGQLLVAHKSLGERRKESEAEGALRRAIALDPLQRDGGASFLSLCRLLGRKALVARGEGQIQEEKRLWAPCIKACKQAVALDPQDAYTAYWLAKLACFKPFSSKAAKKLIRKVARLGREDWAEELQEQCPALEDHRSDL